MFKLAYILCFTEQEEEGRKETTWGRKRADEYGADVTDDVGKVSKSLLLIWSK